MGGGGTPLPSLAGLSEAVKATQRRGKQPYLQGDLKDNRYVRYK